MSLLNCILSRAKCDPQRPAIFLGDRVITYGMIATGTAAAESRLEQLGVTREDLVAIDIGNPARHLIIILALWRLGIPSASIRPDLKAPALASGCTLVLTDTRPAGNEDFRYCLVGEDWFTNPAANDIVLAPAAFAAHEVFRITFSSGSTGRPRPIAHSETAYVRRVFDTLLTSFQRPWSRLLILGGLSTGFGAARALQALWLGLTVCFPRTTEEAVHMISQYGIEAVMGSPFLVTRFLDQQQQLAIPLPTLKSIQFGGASMSFTDLTRLRTTFGADLVEEYASTEASIAGIASGRLLGMRESGPPVFAPILRVEVVQDGSPVRIGQEGELRIKSPSLGVLYGGDRKCPPNGGWFYPGDRGVVQSNGLFLVLGRKDNVINRGGTKRHAEVIEEQLLRHPQVRDVAVVEVKQASSTLVRAVVVPSNPVAPNELVAWAREAPPASIVDDVQLADAIPRTTTGKIAREIVARIWG